MKSWRSLFVLLLLVFCAGAMGAIAKPDAWYVGLAKPWFNPPNAVFAPVWTALYIAMAVAAWRVHLKTGVDRSILLWCLQLALNAIWSPLFFRFHNLNAALVDIALLLFAVTVTFASFRNRDRTAAWLMLPYLLWVAFATLLMISIWRLNPH